MKIALALLSISVLYAEVNCQCTPVGSNNEIEFTAAAVRTPSIYLNTEYPAPCNGTVERWRLCFYRPATHDEGDRYRLTLAVYRRMGTRYEIVGSSLRTITRNFLAQSSNFSCRYINLNAADQFDIQAGDIVGACVYEPSQDARERMDIVSEANGYTLMQNNVRLPCGYNSTPSTIPSNQLSTVDSRLLHLSAIIADPIIPSTPPLAPTMSTTEVTMSTIRSTSIPSTSDTTTADMTTTVSKVTVSESPVETTSTGSDSTMNQTDATSESTTITSDATTREISTAILMTTVNPTTQPVETTSTVSDITTTHTDATSKSIVSTSSTASTVSMTTAATTDQPKPATTSESTVSTIDPPTTSDHESETASTAQTRPVVATTISTTDDNGATSAVTEISDTTMTKDDSTSSTTVAQISAESNGAPNLTIIIGVTIAAVLLTISGIALLTIVAVIIIRHGKSVGVYSLPSNSDSTLNIPNGVDNVTYGIGFHNPGALDTSVTVYDDVTKSVSTGEGNYFELATSGLSNTYESVTAGVYSELSAAYSTTDTQLQHADERNPHGETYCYELEYDYSSPQNFNASYLLLLEKNKQEDIYGNLEAYYTPASTEDEIYSQLKSCGIKSIPHDQIRIMGHLGSGQFGNVEKGMWQSNEVALKTLKTDSTDEDKVKFLQEAAIMAQFKHPNIVTLHGVVSDKEPLILVVELMHRGDLRDYLHALRPDPGELPSTDMPQMLLSFSQHVALGMQYLSGKGFVHRDLAARNILVSKDNICKVADFGMSRDLADETYYVSRGGKIPVKWTAPEAIHYRKYSTASDVWSYGCLLYEIWSLGCKPFEGMANDEVVKILDSNKRLSPPPGCPRMIYQLMIKCWDPIAGSRPSFRELTIVLTGNPQDVLSIPKETLDAHKLAGILGSPLEVGKNVYKDLQDKYCSE